jgi:pyruvate decarboxylase
MPCVYMSCSVADGLRRFVICNEGFTIERFIHGMDAAYNDIAQWDFKELPRVFGAREGKTKSYQIKTKAQVNQLLEDKGFNAADILQLVELYIPKKEAPRALKLTAEASAKTNAKE